MLLSHDVIIIHIDVKKSAQGIQSNDGKCKTAGAKLLLLR
jgi:hypothetical protein